MKPVRGSPVAAMMVRDCGCVSRQVWDPETGKEEVFEVGTCSICMPVRGKRLVRHPGQLDLLGGLEGDVSWGE